MLCFAVLSTVDRRIVSKDVQLLSLVWLAVSYSQRTTHTFFYKISIHMPYDVLACTLTRTTTILFHTGDLRGGERVAIVTHALRTLTVNANFDHCCLVG